jgi:hypothetical protein
MTTVEPLQRPLGALFRSGLAPPAERADVAGVGLLREVAGPASRAHVAGRILVKPVHLAGVGIARDQTVGVKIVTGPIIGIGPWHRIACAPPD